MPSKTDIALWALGELGGGEHDVHTEDVAWKCYEVAPSQFKWEKRDLPDKGITFNALKRAREQGLLSGKAMSWRLTADGMGWINSHRNAIAKGLGTESALSLEIKNFIMRIKSTPLWAHYTKHKTVKGADRELFLSMIRCSPDLSLEGQKIKYERFWGKALLTKNRSIVRFAEQCESFVEETNDA